ncbi:tRNA (adenosine(37)-N6)-threonylcarbamoyltransferase complex transferase subunit TsaD, partial [Candidatus Pelagibacter sp.]|nr:tRNA (adenosine(37)-N6)-threonylcarbamoyltransferase complex transferase subunit TsaD [Candidatus Pelagibacter sp.]
MNKKPIILGIESSCDETAASIITENEQGMPTILSSVVSGQVDVHKEFGGVVPELAARSHIEKIDLITKKAIEESEIKLEKINAIAATAGPGLIVCLSVGLSFGKAMASSLNKPFIAVNHLEGHALSPKLNSKLNYPYLLLLISGGHTQFLSVQGLGKYKRLGTTIDDAVGEAFDKTAKLLGIEFPGGPQIEIYAKKGDPNKYELPKPIFYKGGCNLSFAGLKTAVLKISKQIKTDQEKYDLAASFQKTIEEILYKKSKIAFEDFKKMNMINKNKLDDTFVHAMEGPARFLPIVLGFFIASYYMSFGDDARAVVDTINRTLITILIFWLIHQIVEPISYILSGLDKMLTRELIGWIIKSLKILIFILGLAAVLELWGIKIGPIIAGLGLFGVAVALGAQDLFKN